MNSTVSQAKKSPVVSVPLDDEQIRKLAYEIALEGKTWDELVWLFAESELRLVPAFANQNFLSAGEVTRAIHLYPFKYIDLYPTMVQDHPKDSEIRKIAEKIAAQNPPTQDLHWFIAERTYTYRKIKELT